MFLGVKNDMHLTDEEWIKPMQIRAIEFLCGRFWQVNWGTPGGCQKPLLYLADWEGADFMQGRKNGTGWDG
jgi:hypothetical protein